jgi:hypothetical protein
MRLAHIVLLAAWPLAAQQPFYTDDAATTSKGRFHIEFFNEFDALQREQYPSLRQNTANVKLNFGITDRIELDVDAPYISIIRSRLNTPRRINGVGDADFGVKWNFLKESSTSLRPAFSATLYLEFPTGDTQKQIGSGLVDYALNGIAQRSLSPRTKLTGNVGVIFAGNNSTGLIGVQTRGSVFTGGGSVVHTLTERLSLGVEFNGAVSHNFDLGKSQLTFLGGGSYDLRQGLGVHFAVLGGRYVASPVVGAQLGFSVDFPALHVPR